MSLRATWQQIKREVADYMYMRCLEYYTGNSIGTIITAIIRISMSLYLPTDLGIYPAYLVLTQLL